MRELRERQERGEATQADLDAVMSSLDPTELRELSVVLDKRPMSSRLRNRVAMVLDPRLPLYRLRRARLFEGVRHLVCRARARAPRFVRRARSRRVHGPPRDKPDPPPLAQPRAAR
jgi:hypothetical protein